jgi:hypothetical protein
LESTVAALLLVASTVLFASIVIVYAVETAQNCFDSASPQMKLLNDLQNMIINQTSILNETAPSILGRMPDSMPIP